MVRIKFPEDSSEEFLRKNICQKSAGKETVFVGSMVGWALSMCWAVVEIRMNMTLRRAEISLIRSSHFNSGFCHVFLFFLGSSIRFQKGFRHWNIRNLGCGFKYVLFSSLFGEASHFD